VYVHVNKLIIKKPLPVSMLIGCSQGLMNSYCLEISVAHNPEESLSFFSIPGFIFLALFIYLFLFFSFHPLLRWNTVSRRIRHRFDLRPFRFETSVYYNIILQC
jgi:hypothetical protein